MKWTNIGEIAADKPIQYVDTLISPPTVKIPNNDTVPVNGVNKSMEVTNSRRQPDSLDYGNKDQIPKGN